MLKTGDTFEFDGKTWRFVGVGVPEENQPFIGVGDKIFVIHEPSGFIRPIVEEVLPEWITPTDEHAKQRVECEVRDYECDVWQRRTLIRVRDNRSYSFVTETNDSVFAAWKFCRIRNPDLPKQ